MVGDIPVSIKIAYTLLVCLIVPVYLKSYGPANFLWFSDVALVLMVPALWTESPLLASMMALAVTLPELAWTVDFFGRLLSGCRLLGLADYMFDRRRTRFLRGLSFFHVLLPVLAVGTVHRLGYDPRALVAQTVLGEVVLVLSYLLTDPSKNVKLGLRSRRTAPAPDPSPDPSRLRHGLLPGGRLLADARPLQSALSGPVISADSRAR
jgi:hypothetical protein